MAIVANAIFIEGNSGASAVANAARAALVVYVSFYAVYNNKIIHV